LITSQKFLEKLIFLLQDQGTRFLKIEHHAQVTTTKKAARQRPAVPMAAANVAKHAAKWYERPAAIAQGLG
jgi:hypothetical protein